MIYTLTLNPSIDYVAYVPEFKEGTMNCIETARFFAGGKGINVSRVLHALGVSSTALGLIAGFTGEYIEQSLIRAGLRVDFVHLNEDCSRINFKMKGRKETECNGKGPIVSKEALLCLYRKLDQIQSGDTLVLSGSIPSSIGFNVYRKILEDLKDRSIRIVLDARGPLVLECLDLHPWLLKPNGEELQEMLGVSLETKEELIQGAKTLQERGARNVLVSLGKDGAFLCSQDGHVYQQTAPMGKLRNSSGAGDSMVAGYLFGQYEDPGAYAQALRMAVAAGSATAFQDDLANGEQIRMVLHAMQ